MDKIAERLREDAAKIDVAVSPELEARVRAALNGAADDRHRKPGAAPSRPKSFTFWWASTLTGAALALALIVAVNLAPPPADEGRVPPTVPGIARLDLPAVPLDVRPAVFTRPLEQEYELLQADLEKAGERVRESLEQVF